MCGTTSCSGWRGNERRFPPPRLGLRLSDKDAEQQIENAHFAVDELGFHPTFQDVETIKIHCFFMTYFRKVQASW